MQMTNHQELLFFKNSKIIEVIMLLKKKIRLSRLYINKSKKRTHSVDAYC